MSRFRQPYQQRLSLYVGNGLSDKNETFDGYMSDAYFVDGKIVPPTVFGEFFPGDKWGPLDSSVVKSNLDNLATC